MKREEIVETQGIPEGRGTGGIARNTVTILTPTERLYEIATAVGVAIVHRLPEPLLGFYFNESGIVPVISLVPELEHHPTLFRCVFAEEVGHHFTTGGDMLFCAYRAYIGRVLLSEAEKRALKWAAELLMMPVEVAQRAREHGMTPQALTEAFGVTLTFRKGDYADPRARPPRTERHTKAGEVAWKRGNTWIARNTGGHPGLMPEAEPNGLVSYLYLFHYIHNHIIISGGTWTERSRFHPFLRSPGPGRFYRPRTAENEDEKNHGSAGVPSTGERCGPGDSRQGI